MKIGMIFPAEEEEFLPDIGFAQSAGAVPMAIERLRNENVLPGAEFRYSTTVHTQRVH